MLSGDHPDAIMPPSPPPYPHGHDAQRERRRQVQLARLMLRRLPLIALESLLQRLAGLLLQHPQQAAFVAGMTRRAQRMRLGQDLGQARQLEAEYEAHLARCGIVEHWYDRDTDEATLLARHYRQMEETLETRQPRGLLAWLRPRSRAQATARRSPPPDGTAGN
jgi:hypothetical protein